MEILRQICVCSHVTHRLTYRHRTMIYPTKLLLTSRRALVRGDIERPGARCHNMSARGERLVVEARHCFKESFDSVNAPLSVSRACLRSLYVARCTWGRTHCRLRLDWGLFSTQGWRIPPDPDPFVLLADCAPAASILGSLQPRTSVCPEAQTYYRTCCHRWGKQHVFRTRIVPLQLVKRSG